MHEPLNCQWQGPIMDGVTRAPTRPSRLSGSSAPERRGEGGRGTGERCRRRRVSSAAVTGTEITHCGHQHASPPSPSPRARRCLRPPASPCSILLVGTGACGFPLHLLPLQLSLWASDPPPGLRLEMFSWVSLRALSSPRRAHATACCYANAPGALADCEECRGA